jgi:hypothetical protein
MAQASSGCIGVSKIPFLGPTIDQCQGGSFSVPISVTAPPSVRWNIDTPVLDFYSYSVTASPPSGLGDGIVTVKIVVGKYPTPAGWKCVTTEANEFPSGVGFTFSDTSGNTLDASNASYHITFSIINGYGVQP